MGLFKLSFFGGLLAILAAIAYNYLGPEAQVPPEAYEPSYFGPLDLKGTPPSKDSPAIKPFKVSIDDQTLQDLRQRLKNHRYSEPLPGVNFTYGFRADVLRNVIDYWLNKYDWRRQEQLINSMGDHFKTQIEGLDIHYIVAKPKKPAKKTIPILVVHGWPGSIFEFYKMAPLLTQEKDGVAFEVIMPSIPGYGFSDQPRQPGFNYIACARVFAKLMERLGHKKYAVQGGDWGSLITKAMSIMYPDRVIGYHTNMAFANNNMKLMLRVLAGYLFPSLVLDKPEHEYPLVYPYFSKQLQLISEFGYMLIQATKPDTIGTALNDSPGGLAAYIMEKFSTWTHWNNRNKPDGALTEKYTMDELLTNVMIYWTTGTITSSQRFYKENIATVFDPSDAFGKVPVKVPTGVAAFTLEIMFFPRQFLTPFYHNIVHYSHQPRGGHFAALEEPEILEQDIRKFVSILLQRPKSTSS